MDFDKKGYTKLFGFILSINIGGWITGFLTSSGFNGFYQSLRLPSFIPPTRIFPVAWTALYTLMGVSIYLAWKKGLGRKEKLLFSFQLFLNYLWSIIFFKFQNIFLALIEIILLNLVVALTIYFFKKVDERSAYLLIPYQLWILFALYLNYVIYVLN